MKIAVAVILVICSLILGGFLVHRLVLRHNPPDENCQDLPYSSVPVPAITVGPAEAVAGWENCPSWSAGLQTGLGAGWSPPDPSPHSPPRRLSSGMCRKYRVPLDYSQGMAGGSIIVTVKLSSRVGNL